MLKSTAPISEAIDEHRVIGASLELPAVDNAVEPQVTVIERRPGWQVINFREIWRYRELLLILTWRDIKVRYKQTVLGIAWAVIQPLTMMLVFSLFLGRVAGLDSSGIPYPVFVFAGLLPWIFFSGAIIAAAQSVVGNQSLVTKIYFPRLLIPLSSAGAFFLDLLIGFVILIALMAAYGIIAGLWSLVAVPLIVCGLVVAALGVGILLAALTVEYRDFRHIVPFFVQLWMFATPSIYMNAIDVAGPRGAVILPFNPAYGLIANFRAAVLGRPLDMYSLTVSTSVAIALLLAGCLYFRRVERGFADIV